MSEAKAIKPLAALIVAKKRPGPPEGEMPTESEGEGEEMSGADAAADEAFEALQSGDRASFKEALRAFVQITLGD